MLPRPPCSLLATTSLSVPVSTTFTSCSSFPRICTSAAFSTSTTRSKEPSKLRREFFEWLDGPGAVFQQSPQPGKTNYLTAYDVKTGERRDTVWGTRTPFPLNPMFVATPVVSDELADDVYKRVVESGKSVRMVSAELNVTLERVAAIVRLKTIEKRWEAEGKPVKPFLRKAIHSMLPTTPLPTPSTPSAHEPINDLPAHPQTHVQSFMPVSESRAFTRADAGSTFGILPADELIPHPELITEEAEIIAGVDSNERKNRAMAKGEEDARARKEKQEERERLKEAREMILESGRWRWRLIDAEAGKVGYRYGIPHEDRKKGQIKIPTSVE